MNWVTRPAKQPGRPKKFKALAAFRPRVEALESLTLLSTVSWVGGSGDWQNPNNWNDDKGMARLPGPNDDAVIDVPGISVSHSAAIDSVRSLETSNGTFDLSGGTLRVATTLQGNSTFRISGGATLANANVQSGTTVTGTSSGGRLDRVTLNGDLDMTTSSSISLTITNGLTLNGTASLGNFIGTTSGFLSFSGDQVLGGGGAIVFGGSDSNTLSIGSGTLTIGPKVTVQGGHGNLSGTFLNQGMIGAGAGGALSLNGTGWSNAGSLAALNGGTLSLGGTNWSNTGQITEADSTLNLGGTFSTAALGAYSRSGGSINLTGTLNNTGGTLELNGKTGPWNLLGGRINNGTVSEPEGALLLPTTSGGTLSGVALEGDLDLSRTSSVSVTIMNGLTLDGTISLGNAGGTTAGFLSFSGDQVLGGGGTVVFGGSDSNTLSIGSGTLTIGPKVTVQGGHGNLSGTFLNQGMIGAGAGGALNLNGTGWSNAGTLAALNGGTLNLAGSSSSAGTFTVGAGSTLNFSSGTHTLTADSSVSGDGNVLFSGGTTFVDGTLAATGGISIQQSGTLSGTGTLTGVVLNAGQINPGRIGSAGILTIIGNYTQTTTGVLTIEIGGLNPGDQFDQLSVSGLATLNGTLNVSLISGFRPSDGDSFPILTFGSESGDFSVRTGLDLGGGLTLVPNLGGTSLTLVANQAATASRASGWDVHETNSSLWAPTSATTEAGSRPVNPRLADACFGLLGQRSGTAEGNVQRLFGGSGATAAEHWIPFFVDEESAATAR
jgi:hypothetical protein